MFYSKLRKNRPSQNDYGSRVVKIGDFRPIIRRISKTVGLQVETEVAINH